MKRKPIQHEAEREMALRMREEYPTVYRHLRAMILQELVAEIDLRLATYPGAPVATDWAKGYDSGFAAAKGAILDVVDTVRQK